MPLDSVEVQLKTLLSGGGLVVPAEGIFCDFSLAAQQEVLASKGVTSSGPTSFIPVTKKNVTYIVAAVLVNENSEVLMMQEAKPSCAGEWYLPAGRMEPGETIIDAVKREVLEETGLDMEPSTLLMVQSAAGSWYRFVFAGSVTGGRLKTTSEADSESLQAKWVKNVKELPLRAKDILPLVDKGLEYYKKGPKEPWHSKLLPATIPHRQMLMRVIIGVRKKENNKLHVLVSEKNHVHFPLCELHPQRSLHSTLKKYMNEIFGADPPTHRPNGILSIEYNGVPAGEHDGMCLNLLVSVRDPLESVCLIDKYSWRELSPGPTGIGEDLNRRFGKNLTVPLDVIR